MKKKAHVESAAETNEKEEDREEKAVLFGEPRTHVDSSIVTFEKLRRLLVYIIRCCCRTFVVGYE